MKSRQKTKVLFKRIKGVIFLQIFSHSGFSQTPPISGPTQIDCVPSTVTYIDPQQYNTPVGYAWSVYDLNGHYLWGQSPFGSPSVSSATFTTTFNYTGTFKLYLGLIIAFDPNEVDFDPLIVTVGLPNNSQLIGDYNSGTNQTIRASQQITTSSNAFVHSGAIVLANAGTSIVLSPNFIAQSGSTFTAEIRSNPCSANRLDVVDDQASAVSAEGIQTMRQEEQDNAISLFPNPSNGAMSISLTDEGIAFGDLAVYNSLGEPVYTGKEIVLFKSAYPVDLTCLQNGIYTAEFRTAGKRAWRKKLIIKK